MRERAFNKIDIVERILLADDFAKALDLAFSLKIDDYPGFIRAPFSQARNELHALRLDQHQIANRELANVGILKRAAEIFGALFNPAFTDLDIGVGIFFRLDVDLKMIVREIIAHSTGLIVSSAE